MLLSKNNSFLKQKIYIFVEFEEVGEEKTERKEKNAIVF